MSSGSLLEDAIRTYAKRQIGEIFCLSIDEFLAMPHDIAEMLLKVADEELAAKAKALGSLPGLGS